MPISHVKQEDSLGCQIACAAMIVGCSYHEAREGIAPNWMQESPPGRFEMEEFLLSRGWKVVNSYENFYAARRHAEKDFPWPPQPFAALHLVSVKTHDSAFWGHSVVMLADGTILDPATPQPCVLSDYHLVEQVSSVIPVNGDLK